jgi:hypothetical protein
MSHTRTGTSTRAPWLCLAAAGLAAAAPGTFAASSVQASEQVVPLLRHEAGGGATRAAQRRALRQHEHEHEVLGQGPVTFFLGPTAAEERGHLKDPDLLDGDNPGW